MPRVESYTCHYLAEFLLLRSILGIENLLELV